MAAQQLIPDEQEARSQDMQMEAAVMSQAENVDELLEMLERIDPTKESLTENDRLQVTQHLRGAAAMGGGADWAQRFL